MKDVDQNLEQLFAVTEALAKRVEELERQVERMTTEMGEEIASKVFKALDEAADAYRTRIQA